MDPINKPKKVTVATLNQLDRIEAYLEIVLERMNVEIIKK